MAIPITSPRNLQSGAGPGPQPEAVSQEPSGRWEREAEEPHKSGPEDSATKSSRIYFFVILAIIAGAFAIFLLIRPQ
jgi:hypothetical protein